MRDKPAPAPPAPYLLSALFVTGLCSLSLEIVGTRLIAPMYGSSIHVWSSLITTTLVALAAGYAWGGRLGDRDPRPELFGRLLLAAAAGVAVIPHLREPVLRATAPLGLRLGSLAAAALLTGPALVLIGATGPVVARLRATGAGDAGRSAGDAFAVSTAGSVAGAALTGFVLVPLWPAARILCACAAALAALGAWGAARPGRRAAAAAVAAAVLAAPGLRSGGGRPRGLRERVESVYGRIDVLDAGDDRFLLVNGTIQAEMDRRTGFSASEYDRAAEWVMALRPRARRALALGLGAGLLTKKLEADGVDCDAVEIDPEVARVAREWFGYAPRGAVTVGDARAALDDSGGRRDLIVLDAFGSESPPVHLFTAEAFARMRGALAPGGVLAVNLVTGLEGPEGRPWRATFRTLMDAFPSVRAFVTSTAAPGLHNVMFFASTGPLDAPASAAPAGARAAVAAMLGRELRPTAADLADAPLMTDDHAPLDAYLAGTAARARRLLLTDPPEVLLR